MCRQLKKVHLVSVGLEALFPDVGDEAPEVRDVRVPLVLPKRVHAILQHLKGFLAEQNGRGRLGCAAKRWGKRVRQKTKDGKNDDEHAAKKRQKHSKRPVKTQQLVLIGLYPFCCFTSKCYLVRFDLLRSRLSPQFCRLPGILNGKKKIMILTITKGKETRRKTH